MSRKLLKRLFGVTLGSAVMLSAACWAMGPGGMEHDPVHMAAHLSSRLDLSEEQRQQVEAIMESARGLSAKDHQRMQELRKQMRSQSQNFDAGKAQQLADEIGEITSRMVYQFSSTHAQIFQLLNEEQRVEMAKLMEQREARRDKWRKGGRRDRE